MQGRCLLLRFSLLPQPASPQYNVPSKSFRAAAGRPPCPVCCRHGELRFLAFALARSRASDLNYLRTQVRDNQIEAVVVSRLIKVEKTVTYVPGGPYFVPYPYYGTFYGYFGTVYPMVYSPDYLREDKKVRIETNLYVISAPDGKLVWTGITDTFNPNNVHKAINRLVKLVLKQMQSEGVL
jgi:hypothetical protein